MVEGNLPDMDDLVGDSERSNEGREEWLAALPDVFDEEFLNHVTFKEFRWLHDVDLNEQQRSALADFDRRQSERLAPLIKSMASQFKAPKAFGAGHAKKLAESMQGVRSAMKPLTSAGPDTQSPQSSLVSRPDYSEMITNLPDTRIATYTQAAAESGARTAEAVIALADAAEDAAARELKMLFWTRVAGIGAIVAIVVAIMAIWVTLATA